MKICLVATFPPSGRQLNEYAFHIARELQRIPYVELTILADELTDYEFATDENGEPIKAEEQPELPGFHVIRCWKFNSLSTPVRLLNTIRQVKPDVVWFNLVFSSFATPENPVAAFAGLSAPALSRASGYYTHITLHQVIEHVDFAAAGVGARREKLLRMGTHFTTQHPAEGGFGFCASACLPAHAGREVCGAQRSVGQTWNLCSHPGSPGFQQARQSGTPSSGDWPLGHL